MSSVWNVVLFGVNIVNGFLLFSVFMKLVLRLEWVSVVINEDSVGLDVVKFIMVGGRMIVLILWIILLFIFMFGVIILGLLFSMILLLRLI